MLINAILAALVLYGFLSAAGDVADWWRGVRRGFPGVDEHRALRDSLAPSVMPRRVQDGRRGRR